MNAEVELPSLPWKTKTMSTKNTRKYVLAKVSTLIKSIEKQLFIRCQYILPYSDKESKKNLTWATNRTTTTIIIIDIVIVHDLEMQRHIKYDCSVGQLIIECDIKIKCITIKTQRFDCQI